MKTKIIVSSIILTLIISLFTNICFAENEDINMMDDAQDMVNGASNFVEDTASDIGNGVAEITEDVGNTISDAGSSIMDTFDIDNNSYNNYIAYSDNNNSYTAQRTATTTNNNFLGIGSTAWTWLIMGVVGIAIVALVWYYGTEHEKYHANNHDNY